MTTQKKKKKDGKKMGITRPRPDGGVIMLSQFKKLACSVCIIFKFIFYTFQTVPFLILQTYKIQSVPDRWSRVTWTLGTRLVHCQKFGSKWRTRVRVASLMAAESCEKMYGISTKIQNKTNTS